ncbi:MAG: hypothetical protein DMF00_17250 [Verrucomicrobia bacterium]|nr:MAG: hypothetical protein DMF00_17250 [Verrucomicrobiota bacterium]
MQFHLPDKTGEDNDCYGEWSNSNFVRALRSKTPCLRCGAMNIAISSGVISWNKNRVCIAG